MAAVSRADSDRGAASCCCVDMVASKCRGKFQPMVPALTIAAGVEHAVVGKLACDAALHQHLNAFALQPAHQWNGHRCKLAEIHTQQQVGLLRRRGSAVTMVQMRIVTDRGVGTGPRAPGVNVC